LLFCLSKSQTSIAFLGAGTLGTLFSHFTTNPVSIFDIDEVLLKRIQNHSSKSVQAICFDVSKDIDKSFRNFFQLVFVDPPWSAPLLRTFLARSSTFVSLGGFLVISFPQTLTRPSIPLERNKLMKLARSLGLALKAVLPSFTEYSVPLFEQNAYKHYGINLKNAWRRGDLLIFSKTNNSSIKDVSHLIKNTPEWNQYQHKNHRLFLKRDGFFEDGIPSVKLIQGLGGLTYISTSSRLAFWKSASLVSTRNCIAQAYGRKKLSILLRDILNETVSSSQYRQDISLPVDKETQKAIFSMLRISNSSK
jgi:predicted RNA methylase